MSLIAGKNLRKIREQLNLRYRDVEEASQIVARRRNNSNFLIGLSRLADIEHRGTVPSIYRLYSLASIYGIEFGQLLRWYNVDLTCVSSDAVAMNLNATRPVHLAETPEAAPLPSVQLDQAIDFTKTRFAGRQATPGAKEALPVSLLKRLDFSDRSYAIIGADDWAMHPLIAPGSIVQIDETKRRIATGGWSEMSRRPIYFIEYREGFRCGWCTETAGTLIVLAHPASSVPPAIFKNPGEAEVLGQIVAVTMRLDLEKPLRKRSSTNPK